MFDWTWGRGTFSVGEEEATVTKNCNEALQSGEAGGNSHSGTIPYYVLVNTFVADSCNSNTNYSHDDCFTDGFRSNKIANLNNCESSVRRMSQMPIEEMDRSIE
ncbi:uncharacterized protein LOC132295126 isoform X4 [Cornus florida]|uniref:uncharacterized protein LOC132295126 isoform X4 n=1 Tax=Cornus florida TaxID=4283 RepID=UPI00289D0B47|nr:uncharacterized protein LOC132295126 isoform X4 [Cornus florida]